MLDTEPAVLAMADALVEASGWSDRLYPDNGWLNEDEQVSDLVRFALGDGEEPFRVEMPFGGTHLVVHATGRVVPLPPDVSRAFVDAALRAAAPTVGGCDYCSRAVVPIAGLLPVPAGATVVGFALCGTCLAFLRSTVPGAHYITLED